METRFDMKKFIELRKKGYSLDDISDTMGVSVYTLLKHSKYVDVKKICLICGKEFKAKRSSNVYCSEKCRNIAIKQKSKESRKRRINRKKIHDKITALSKEIESLRGMAESLYDIIKSCELELLTTNNKNEAIKLRSSIKVNKDRLKKIVKKMRALSERKMAYEILLKEMIGGEIEE